MASDGRIELELTVKDNASGQVNSIVSDIEHKVNRASGDVKIGLKASDEASKVIDQVKDKTEKGAEGKATLKADDQATSVINAAKENTEKGAEGTATIKADDQASDTIKTVREDYEKGAEGKATVTGDNADAAGAMARARTDYEKGAEGKATVTGDDEATETLASVRTDYETGAEGKATVTGADEATETLTSVRTDYERGAEGTATIKGDNTGARSAISEAVDAANKGEGKITVGGKADVSGAVSEAVDAANRGEGKITINGDPTPALGAIEEIIAAANGADVTINLGADGSGAPDGGGSGSGSGSGIGGKIAGAAWGAAKDVVSGVFSAGMNYEQKLATVATLAQIGNPNADMDAFGRAMMDIASDTGQDVGVVLDAAYNALSSNVSWGDDAQGTSLQNYIRTQAELAVAGRTDVDTAQNATSALMNMYASTLANNPEAAERIGVIDEARIANMMVKGAYKGRFDVNTLATNMSSSMNTAASLGIAPEDIVAMYAVLTQQAISMPAADTGVYRMIASLKDNDSDAAKYMRKAMKAEGGVKGINDKTTLGDLINQGYTIQQIVTEMGNWGQKQGKPIALDDMFSLAIAGRAAQGLYNARDFWKESQEYMRGDDQLVEATMGIMSGTTTFSLSRIKAQFQSYGAMLYDALAPAVHKVLGLVSGDKFQLLMTNLTNKIARFLESDALENLIDGLVNAAGSLLDVLNGKKSWGEFFSEITGGLKEVADQFMTWISDGFIEMLNTTIPKIPVLGAGFEHIETSSEREAREKKEEAYRQWRTENGLNPEGTYFTAADGNTYFTSSSAYESVRDSLNGIIEPALGLDEETVNEEVERYLGKTGGENGEYLRRITDEEARALDNGGFEAWYAGQLASEEQKAQNLGTLDQYDIYDAKSFSRLAGSAMRTQDPEAIGQLQDVLIAIGDLAAGGETGWWSKGAQDYSNGVASDEGVAYAAIQSAADSAAASTEDAAAGMDDVARTSSRVSSSMSGLPGTLTSLATAAAYASGELSNVHYAGYLHAVGLDRVPYDNYPALLHKGEMVLTAAEASAYRFGGTGSSGGGFDVNGLASAIAGMAVQMDGKTVGRLVERSVSQEQGVRYNRQARKG